MLAPSKSLRAVSIQTLFSLRKPPRNDVSDSSRTASSRGAASKVRLYLRTVWVDICCIAAVAACIPPVLYMPIFFPEQRLVPMRPPVSPSAEFDMANLTDFGLPPELSFPRKPELVPTWVCGYIVVFSPIAIISLFQLKIRSMWDFHAGTSGILKAVVTTTFVQVLLKQFMGGARPYLIDVCKPNLSLLRKAVSDAQLFFDITACTGNERDVNIALQSFPSGHTANSFAVAIFLALYINAKLKPFADHGAYFWTYMATILPLLCASLIGGSMFISHQHHAHDIIFGMMMGLFLGTLAFRSSYASILDFRYNHVPLPPSSICTRLSYRSQVVASLVPYAKDARYLQVWEWWDALNSEANDEKEKLWLRSTRDFGAQNGLKNCPLARHTERQQHLVQGIEAIRAASDESTGTVIHTERGMIASCIQDSPTSSDHSTYDIIHTAECEVVAEASKKAYASYRPPCTCMSR